MATNNLKQQEINSVDLGGPATSKQPIQSEIVKAIWESDMEMLGSLLGKGVSINKRDGDGLMLLHHAVKKGNPEMVSTLLTYGADCNRKSRSKQTPLALVLEKNTAIDECQRISLVMVLISKGTDLISYRDYCGRTYLHKAIKMGNLTILEYTLAQTDCKDIINIKDKFQKTIVFEAVRQNKVDILNCLLSTGLHNMFFDYDKKGFLPLHYAIKNGYVEMVENILEHLRKLNPVGNVLESKSNGLTPFLSAARYGQLDILKYFLQADFTGCYLNINETDKYGCNALIHIILQAFQQHRHANVKLLGKLQQPWTKCAHLLIKMNIDLSCETNYTIFWPSTKFAYHPQNALEIITKSGLFNLTKLLALAGCPLGNMELNLEYVLDKFLKKNEYIVNWLKIHFSQVFSLKDLCRQAFRKAARNRFRFILPQLHIPTTIKDYLQYCDLIYLVDQSENEDRIQYSEPCDSEEEYDPSYELKHRETSNDSDLSEDAFD